MEKKVAVALVVLSGGQDSTTCLYWAKHKFEAVKTITFDYGQKHFIEMSAARTIAKKARVTNQIIDAPKLLGTSPLVNSNKEVAQYESTKDLPDGVEATFVPGRNALFLTLAANYAYAYGITEIVMGVGQTDYANYPDCRDRFIFAMERALSLGFSGEEKYFNFYTPLMHMTKKQTVLLAKELDCLDAMVDTHTCYNGTKPACGKCHACLLRLRGFKEAGIEDPLEYANTK